MVVGSCQMKVPQEWGYGAGGESGRNVHYVPSLINPNLEIVCPSNRSSTSKLLNKKRNLLYIRNESVPRSKHFPPRL